MGHVWFTWGLRAVVLLYCPAALVVTWLHPGLRLDAVAAGVPMVTGSGLTLMKKAGPLHQCPGRHQGRRVLWAAIRDNQRRLDQYDGWLRTLGAIPSERTRKRDQKRDLTLIQGGDSNPGRRVSLPA